MAAPSTPAPVYLPPSNSLISNVDTTNEQLQSTSGSIPLRLRVQEMRCLKDGYFKAALKVDSFITSTPTVDNDSSDRRCDLKLQKSFVIVDIAGEDFHRCGIRSCGKDLCLRLRFPAIRGMRTANDAILTLHCKTQDRVAVKTHAVRMGVANDV